VSRSTNPENIPARALLDSGNHGSNVISAALIETLGLLGEIKHYNEAHIPEAEGIDRMPFIPIGTIKLYWRFDGISYSNSGWKLCNFQVSKANNIQVIFGLSYMMENDILPPCRSIMAPLIPVMEIQRS
jgi:hypothetical protein